MRLRQLARKLNVDTDKLIRHLVTNNLPCEDDSNAKLTEEQATLLISAFGPLQDEPAEEAIEINEQTFVQPEEEIIPAEPIEQILAETEEIVEVTTAPLPEPTQESTKPSVIRAPKVELSGLKVVGKIELRTPRKKEETESTEPAEKSDQPVRSKPRFSADRSRQQRKPEKKSLSIADQRKREEKIQQRKKKDAEAKAKVKRKENYLKKVKAKDKPVTKTVGETEAVATRPKAKEETGLFRKFFNWIRRE